MSRERPIDAVALATGLVLVAFGVLLLADALGWIGLDLGWAACASSALAGIVLLIGGIAEGER